MILKKPYALLIKYFRLLHLLISLFVIYSIYKLSILLGFFNNYLTNQDSFTGLNLQTNFFSIFIFVVCSFIIVISLILLWLMVKKKKPFRFYLYNFLVYLIDLIFVIYLYVFLGKLGVSLVDVLNIRVVRDLLIIMIILQSISLMFALIRTVGFDIKSFEFKKDLQQLEISDEDQEEYEIEFNYDSNEMKRKRKKYFRFLKYSYKENKLFINFIIIVLFCFALFFLYSKINIYTITNKEGKDISTEFYDMNVEGSYLVNTNYRGIRITDNYLIVINLKIRSKGMLNKIILGNFKIKIGDNIFSFTSKYDNQLIDFGKVYNNDYISDDYKNYLMVYEVPPEQYNSDVKFIYYENGNSVKIKLNPISKDYNVKEFNLGDTINLSDKDSVTITNYDIQEKYMIDYDFCLKDTCYKSVQYIVPSLNTNYDKAIIKINGSSVHDDNSLYNSFSNLVSGIGYIEYRIYGYDRYSFLDSISNLRKSEDNVYYFEVNKEIINSDSIRIVFYTKKCKYVYILK